MNRGIICNVVGIAALAGFVVACGSTKPPTYRLTQSKAAIRAAEEVGAPDAPQAALYLKMARDQVRQAENLIIDQSIACLQFFLRRARNTPKSHRDATVGGSVMRSFGLASASSV